MTNVVLVTGASRGIGAATARLAGARGYAVCVNYLASPDAAKAVARHVEEAGGKAMTFQADTASEDDVVRMFAAVDERFGPLTALVNNAGITGGARAVADVDCGMLRRVFDVNVVGCFLCAREAVRRMSTKKGGAGGAIVNVSSMASRIGGAGEWVHYGASKGAVDTLTIGLAREVADQGIRVNAVSPGLIDTDIHAAAGFPDRMEKLAPTVPMKRGGSPEEVAETVLWLMSEAASYVTGVIVPVSGGR
jgi:NAD(P)-dependent dehydrogenase (short-subunit alcohol dehydrogenase family)